MSEHDDTMVALATITARALRAEDALRDAEDALREAIAEIEGSPYQTEPWGWGIAYRIERWRALTRLAESIWCYRP